MKLYLTINLFIIVIIVLNYLIRLSFLLFNDKHVLNIPTKSPKLVKRWLSDINAEINSGDRKFYISSYVRMTIIYIFVFIFILWFILNYDLVNDGQEIGSQVKDCLNRTEDIRKYLENWNDKNKLFDDNPIRDWIHDFNNYLSTLSIFELCFLMNILMCTFIFSCLISILFSFYGSFLIDKFNLESKFPRLSGLIKLRVKLLHSSVLINSLLIVIALVFLLYLNIHTLLLN